MRRTCRQYTIIGMVILLSVALPPAPASAGWRFASDIYGREERVCRDGVTLSFAYYGGKDEAENRGSITTYASVRLYSEPDVSLGEPDSEGPQYPFEYYGPLLVATTPITMVYDPVARPPLVDGGTFYMYSLNNVIPWTRQLQTGDTVLIQAGSATWHVPVGNCFLNRVAIDEGSTLTIGRDRLNADDGMTAPTDMTFRLDAVPANGILRRNGVVLTAGSVFTQDDINNTRLTYVHNGSQTTSDSFAFSVSATSRVSVDSSGAQAIGGPSFDPSLSGTGSSIAFTSEAVNLVANDTNNVCDRNSDGVFAENCADIFLHKRASQSTVRVSLAASGTQGNGPSSSPSISAYGSVAFASAASNLVNGEPDQYGYVDCSKQADMNGVSDVFMSTSYTDSEGRQEIYINRHSVSDGPDGCREAAAASFNPAIVPDGGATAFTSDAANLPQRSGYSDSNGVGDIYAGDGYDETYRHSIGSGSIYYASTPQANGPSDRASVARRSGPDSFLMAFQSQASNLVPDDTNNFCDNTPGFINCSDIFVRDDINGDSTTRISVSTLGKQANDASFNPSMSAAGRFVAYQSLATNLVDSDTNRVSDIFVHDRTISETTRVSLTSRGSQVNGSSRGPSISASGRYVAFRSDATDIVAGDTNATSDVFVHDRLTGETRRASVSSTGAQAIGGPSADASISYDGCYVAFESSATNLVGNDTNRQRDIFIHYLGFSSVFRITVKPIDDAPVAHADSYTMQEDSSLNITAPGILANDIDEEHDALTAVKVREPSHGSLRLNANGSFTYKPAANVNGTDSFTYRVSTRSGNSNVATVRIRINDVTEQVYLPILRR